MKNYQYLLILFSFVFLQSCEEVVTIDLEKSEPKLVIEANLNWLQNSNETNQTIRLSTTTGFYDQEIPPVTNAVIWVSIGSTNQIITFNETGNGYYAANIPFLLNETYKIHVEYNNEVYEGTETLKSVPTVNNITQSVFEGLDEDYIRLDAYFQDNASTDDYYFVQWMYGASRPDYEIVSDEFYNGNNMSSTFINSQKNNKLVSGNVVKMSLSSISKKSYNYLSKVFQSGDSGPFSSPIGAIRGNIINITNPDNYPLGYFNVSERSEKSYTIQ
ncbi:DUF4249 domain-containing protein [Paenimyroides ceti]